MTPSTDPGQLARRIFLWTMIVSFSLAAAAGILVLLGGAFGETGGNVLATTVVVGLYSLAMLCCAAVFTRPGRWVGVVGVGVALLSLLWTVMMIWSTISWDWEPTRVLASGVTLTVATSFASLQLALTVRRDAAIRWLLGAALALLALAAVLTLLVTWNDWWNSEAFDRFYGIVLILTVLAGVLAPLLAALRRRTAPAETAAETAEAGDETTTPAVDAPAHTPAHTPGIDPKTAAALQAEADRRGITVAQLVAPLLDTSR